MRTAVDDLRGVARLMADTPVARFLGVGVVSTIAFALLFLLSATRSARRGPTRWRWRSPRWGTPRPTGGLTFGIHGRGGLVRHRLRGALVFVLTLALTTGALLLQHGLDPAPARPVKLAVLVVASLAATVTRYLALRTWVFTHARRRDVSRRPAPAELR